MIGKAKGKNWEGRKKWKKYKKQCKNGAATKGK